MEKEKVSKGKIAAFLLGAVLMYKLDGIGVILAIVFSMIALTVGFFLGGM